MELKRRSRRTADAGPTKQASDRQAGGWDIPYSRAEFDQGEETQSVGNPYDDDPMGEVRGRPGHKD